ncbi:DUF86 domain-containing protein [Rhodococcus sp. GXMU-t2271]|uniref:HepT-like ribonuclease domain-containing protein n=1 Tax=Rhodococcus sp. GXMU-t2271 TaxID=3059079 RepID=UPI00352B9504
MRPEAPGLLWDARKVARLVAQFVADRTWHEYESDAMLRSAVERQFEIIGEALNSAQPSRPGHRHPDPGPATDRRFPERAHPRVRRH